MTRDFPDIGIQDCLITIAQISNPNELFLTIEAELFDRRQVCFVNNSNTPKVITIQDKKSKIHRRTGRLPYQLLCLIHHR